MSPGNTLKPDGATLGKRGTPVRQRTVRSSANVKSRAIVSTDSSTSDDGSPSKEDSLEIETPTKGIISRPSNESTLTESRPKERQLQLRNEFTTHRSNTSTSSDEIENEMNKIKVSLLFVQ